jgi:hypothetical protein
MTSVTTNHNAASVVPGVVLAPNGQLPYRWPSIKVQTRQKMLDHGRENRRQRAAEYWASEEQDPNHYSIDDYEVYLATGSWAKMREASQERFRQLAEEDARVWAERQEEIERQAEERRLAEWLLPSNLLDGVEFGYLDDEYDEDLSEYTDTGEEGFLSDSGENNDDYL